MPDHPARAERRRSMLTSQRGRPSICRHAGAPVTRDSLEGRQTAGTGPVMTHPGQAGRLS